MLLPAGGEAVHAVQWHSPIKVMTAMARQSQERVPFVLWPRKAFKTADWFDVFWVFILWFLVEG